jgi:hypothetical protein
VFISGLISGLPSSLRLPFFAPHISTVCPRIKSLVFGYGFNDIQNLPRTYHSRESY